MRPRPAMLVLGIASCAPAVPDSCAPMCAAAADLYGGCLAGAGVDWSAAGYDDEQAFVHSCETWAWEQAHVLDDALARGATEDADWLEQTCTERAAVFSDPGATCDDFTGVDWDAVPWD